MFSACLAFGLNLHRHDIILVGCYVEQVNDHNTFVHIMCMFSIKDTTLFCACNPPHSSMVLDIN